MTNKEIVLNALRVARDNAADNVPDVDDAMARMECQRDVDAFNRVITSIERDEYNDEY